MDNVSYSNNNLKKRKKYKREKCLHNKVENLLKGRITEFKGKKWYFYLKKKGNGTSLMDVVDNIEDKLIVSIKGENDIYLFSAFVDYINFYNYSKFFSNRHKCFYEICLGNNRQKPRFDIDVDIKSYMDYKEDHPNFEINDIKDVVIKSVSDILKRDKIELDFEKDVLIFSSHGSEIKKWSFHIIIDNYCHSNNREAKGFYDLVMIEVKKIFPDIPGGWVDPSVYKSCQQFRIAESQKYNKKIPKVFMYNWTYREIDEKINIQYKFSELPENEDHMKLLVLQSSLLTVTDYCKILPNSYDKTQKNTYIIEKDIDEDTIEYAMSLLCKHIGLNLNDKLFPFEIREVKNSLIILYRKRPSYCKICNRVHDSENPYITIGIYKIYYCCRRSNTKFCLGYTKLSNDQLYKENIDEYDELTLWNNMIQKNPEFYKKYIIDKKIALPDPVMRQVKIPDGVHTECPEEILDPFPVTKPNRKKYNPNKLKFDIPQKATNKIEEMEDYSKDTYFY